MTLMSEITSWLQTQHADFYKGGSHRKQDSLRILTLLLLCVITFSSCFRHDARSNLASWGGHAEVIEVLLQKGANGNARTNEGMTAIHLASMGGHVSSMEALAPTCDILLVTRDGKSALHLAAEYGNLGAVQWLHLQGLATSLKDHSGQTPLQYAKDEGHKKVMDFLKRLDQQTLNQRRVKQRSPEALAQVHTFGLHICICKHAYIHIYTYIIIFIYVSAGPKPG
ncbi:ankyrin repeat and death domain-containing protein 1A-like [Penaeus monodon]|uniref:ankyrin repeat and death domain-containing protein 1A-like n=1 Tax=Penaeus monodon TaxID=6687 RepID=UPI0018A7BF98|nr:ankyrin repeat and death domain-containing protein 1A-like [Penaeus monodon]